MGKCQMEVKDGYCPVRRQGIPLSFCLTRCRYRFVDIPREILEGSTIIPEIPKLPSLPKMALNLLRDTPKIVHSMATRTPLTQEEIQARYDICLTCEKALVKNSKLRCTVCGCMMKYKVKFKELHCPEKRW